MLTQVSSDLDIPNTKYVLFFRTEVCFGLEIRHVDIISCFAINSGFLSHGFCGGRQTSETMNMLGKVDIPTQKDQENIGRHSPFKTFLTIFF